MQPGIKDLSFVDRHPDSEMRTAASHLKASKVRWQTQRFALARAGGEHLAITLVSPAWNKEVANACNHQWNRDGRAR